MSNWILLYSLFYSGHQVNLRLNVLYNFGLALFCCCSEISFPSLTSRANSFYSVMVITVMKGHACNLFIKNIKCKNDVWADTASFN